MTLINLKPNKPEAYDGTRDYLLVNTWIYNVEQYLNLSQLSSQNVVVSDHNRIAFASSYLKKNAAVWWFNKVNSPESPTTWDSFKNALTAEFIPEDHCRRARNCLRKIRQTSSVEKYLAEFRNVVLMISDMNESEKVDRFLNGLKYQVKVEVMKNGVNSFEECARMAVNVDSAIWGARMSQNGFNTNHSTDRDGTTLMDIGNINSRNSSNASRGRRTRNDKQKGAWFKCHKAGYRPWKCDPSRINNLNISDENRDKEGQSVPSPDSEKE